MRLIITTREKEAADEIRWSTRKTPGIEVHQGKFEDLRAYDCVATAGNSFGLMDSGMDLAVVKFFGTRVMERIQERIVSEYLGEQPVGTCVIVPTDDPKHPFVAHAPTMRIPMNISGTDHVYLATWAVLTEVHRHNRDSNPKIDVLVCCAFGTGTGGVQPLEAGVQMRIAYEHFCKPPTHITGSLAQSRQDRIHYGGRWGFQNARKIE